MYSSIIRIFILMGLFSPALAPAATVVEFYNTTLDNYFITADSGEAAAIDGGAAGPGWNRTGNTFTSGGSTSVCRFYGSQSPGPNSHFFTVDPGECQGLQDQQIPTGDPRKLTDKSWNFESLDFVSTPATNQTCPSGTVPVYRAYNNGFTRGVDSNHRITTNLTAIQQQVACGWNNEGIVMCAPTGTSSGGTTSCGADTLLNTTSVDTLNAPFSDASVDASVTALRQSGVNVVGDDGAALSAAAVGAASAAAVGAASPGLALLQFQARGMAQERANRDGTSGASIDRMTPPIPLPYVNKSITISMMLAVYVKTADTNGAKIARGLMGNIDPARHAEYIYPSIVLMSFLQEVAVPLLAEMEAANGSAAGLRTSAPLAAAIRAASFTGDPCAAINEFLDDLPATVSRAVNSISPERSGFLSTLLSATAIVAGVATEFAVDAAKGLIRHAPGVDAVRSGMTALHAAADVKSMLTQWKVEVTGGPGNLHMNPGSPTAGTFTVTLSNGGPAAPSWPPVVQSCASLLNIPLPDFNNPNATVEWETIAGFDALAIESSRENILATSKAEFKFNTATELQSLHDNPNAGKETGPATVSATVSLPGLESLLSALTPSIGSGGIGRAARGIASGATSAVAQELGTAKEGSVPVEYHVSKPASADLSGYISLRAFSCGGVSGDWTGKFTEDSPLSGPWLATANWKFDSNNTAVVSYTRTTTEECTVNTETRTWSLVLSGLPNAPVIDGEVNAAQSSYSFEVDGSACDPPDAAGTISAPGQHLGIAPIVLGPCVECAAP